MKKIVLMCQQGVPMELSPARYQLIDKLNKLNYEVYVFFPGVIKDKQIRENITSVINTKSLTVKETQNRLVKIEPDYVIASTFEDTQILYSVAWKMKKTTFIYYNLEIYTPEMEMMRHKKGILSKTKYSHLYIISKMKEVVYSKRCDLLVIQDKLRQYTLKKYYIHNKNTLLIPNSYTYSGENIDNSNRHGIIYSGGITQYQLESLLNEIDDFPDIPVMLSGWTDAWAIKQCKKLKKQHPQLEVQNMTVPTSKFDAYLQKYAVGLIWYSVIGNDNIDNIGLSSGKLFKHLSLEQPVIAMDCPGLGRVVRKYKLGKTIHNVSEIKEAYEDIMKNYSLYQGNIRKVYQKKFDYDKVIQPFLKYLEA